MAKDRFRKGYKGSGHYGYTAGRFMPTRLGKDLKKSSVTDQQLRMIAFLWLVKGWSRSSISKQLDLTPHRISSATGARIRAFEWADIVGDLVKSGYDLTQGNRIRDRRRIRSLGRGRSVSHMSRMTWLT